LFAHRSRPEFPPSIVTRHGHTLLQYVYSTRADEPANQSRVNMQGPLGSYFQNTVAICFDVALDMMGPIVREAVVDQLGKRGILEKEIGLRFEDALGILFEKFGSTGRMIVYNTLAQVCEEYSFPVGFTHADPLDEKFVFLKDRVLVDRLTPRHTQSRMREAPHLALSYRSIFDLFSTDSQRVRA
jgi:hypothetical protein